MLLNMIYLISALFAAALCGLTGSFGTNAWLWVLPLGFVGGFLGCLLVCLLVVVYQARKFDPNKEQEQDDPIVRTIVKLYAPAVFRLLGCKIETIGTEKLPKDGRFLLVSNHLHDLDPGVILSTFPDAQLAFIAKKEVFDMAIIGQMLPRILGQFIDRENDRNALRTILKCISILKEDKASVAVFPEGKITGDDKLHQFRPGVFKMATKAGVPIVVCTLFGTQDITKNIKRLRRTHIRLHLVDMIPAEELKGVTTVDIAHRVHALMAQSLGPENVAD